MSDGEDDMDDIENMDKANRSVLGQVSKKEQIKEDLNNSEVIRGRGGRMLKKKPKKSKRPQSGKSSKDLSVKSTQNLTEKLNKIRELKYRRIPKELRKDSFFYPQEFYSNHHNHSHYIQHLGLQNPVTVPRVWHYDYLPQQKAQTSVRKRVRRVEKEVIVQ